MASFRAAPTYLQVFRMIPCRADTSIVSSLPGSLAVLRRNQLRSVATKWPADPRATRIVATFAAAARPTEATLKTVAARLLHAA
jgi:hypothetical protein